MQWSNATVPTAIIDDVQRDEIPGQDAWRMKHITGIEAPAGAGDSRWLTLRFQLWPQSSETEHRRETAEEWARGLFVRLAISADHRAVGLVEASKRRDYVNGTSSSPVAFVEGLYVEPAARRKGVARALLLIVERWAADEGCNELASDSSLDNVAAHAVHRALGFEETERVVYFRRIVDGASAEQRQSNPAPSTLEPDRTA